MYTQFEAIYARRVFPCVDEPDSKVPWQLTLDVAEGLRRGQQHAVDNESPTRPAVAALSSSRATQAAAELPGRVRRRAVRDRRCRQDEERRAGAHRRRSPGRARRCRVGREDDAARSSTCSRSGSASRIRTRSSTCSTIPMTVGFGAMENAGPRSRTPRPDLLIDREASVVDAAARLGHRSPRTSSRTSGSATSSRWRGGTTSGSTRASRTGWSSKIIARSSSRRGTTSSASSTCATSALGADSARHARARSASRSRRVDDIFNVFDGITYDKGASVLNMFESYVGADMFQKGVREYLKAHAYGNATSTDFWSRRSSQGVGQGSRAGVLDVPRSGRRAGDHRDARLQQRRAEARARRSIATCRRARRSRRRRSRGSCRCASRTSAAASAPRRARCSTGARARSRSRPRRARAG